MPTFSEFIRNASEDEKRSVYRKVIDESTKRQQETLAGRPREYQDAEPEVNFDLGRMKHAVAGPFRTLPEGLTREELRDWMLNDKPQEHQP